MPVSPNATQEAYARYRAARLEHMTCPECHVEWKGSTDPCWSCGRSGVHKYPEEEKT